MEFVFHISDGKITNSAAVRKQFNSLKAGKYLCRIDSVKKRSLQQNKFYWSCVVPLVKDGLRNVGYGEIKTNEDCHEVLKHLFLKRKIVNENTDEVIEIAGSTAKLTTLEFINYLEEIAMWSASYLNLAIPAPGEAMVMF